MTEGKAGKDAWFWTKEWQAKERLADEQFKNGNYQTFDNVDDLIAALHKLTTKSKADRQPSEVQGE